jgi:hypothetical protein
MRPSGIGIPNLNFLEPSDPNLLLLLHQDSDTSHTPSKVNCGEDELYGAISLMLIPDI